MKTATDRRSRTHRLHKKNPNKDLLVSFMRSGEECGICEGYVEDYATGEDVKTIVDCDYERDGLLWSAVDLYNLEHYDLELLPEFCEAALAIMRSEELRQTDLPALSPS